RCRRPPRADPHRPRQPPRDRLLGSAGPRGRRRAGHGPELLRRPGHAHPGRRRTVRARRLGPLRLALPARRGRAASDRRLPLGHGLPAQTRPEPGDARSLRAAGVDHEREVMPLMLAELRRALQEIGADEMAADAELLHLLYPFGRRGGGIDDAHRRTRDVLRDALEAATAPDPVWVMVYRVLNALRIQVNRLIDLGGYTTDSVRRDIDGHLRNAFASWASGPPVQRVRQLLALEEAGLIEFTGPAMHIGIDEDAGRYTAH